MARGSRNHRAIERGRAGDGPSPSTVAGSRRAVSSGVDPHERGPAPSPQLPRAVTTMFAPLIEKLGRREDLTTDEAANAMSVIMRGEAAPAQIAALLIGLSMKGERPAELVGLAKTMRAEAVPLS